MEYYEKYSLYSDSVKASELKETSDMLSQVEKSMDVERKNAALASSQLRLVAAMSILVVVVIIASVALIGMYLKHKRKQREQQERVRRYRLERSMTEKQRAQQNKERIAFLENELTASNHTLSKLRQELIRNEAEMLKYKDALTPLNISTANCLWQIWPIRMCINCITIRWRNLHRPIIICLLRL